MITPFHFACFAEECLRVLCTSADPALGKFLKITRHNSLSEHRSKLSFAAVNAPDGASHVTLSIALVPQKSTQTALNCTLTCPSAKLSESFRVLFSSVEESQAQITKIFTFLQKAFATLNYAGFTPGAAAPAASASADAVAAAINATTAAAGKRTVVAASEDEDEITLPDNNKYILEKHLAKGQPVKMRTHDGKYVPEGELPAKLIVND